MSTFAIMIIWFGTGQYAQFDTEQYDSLATCEAAKATIVRHYEDRWSRIGEGAIECIEVQQ